MISIAALVTMMALAPAYGARGLGMHRCSHGANGWNDRQNDGCREEERGDDGSRHVKAEMKKGNMEGCMKYMKQAHTAMGLHWRMVKAFAAIAATMRSLPAPPRGCAAVS